MSGRCIFLTGAPEAGKLDWSEATLLCASNVFRNATQLDSSAPLPKWRALKTAAPAARTRASIDESVLPSGIGALSPDLESADFLEHSFAILQDPSMVATDVTDATFATTTSFSSTMPSPTVIQSGTSAVNLYHSTLSITDLRSLPSAALLLFLHPQTPTVNLLCAVISLSPARTVRLRRHPDREMEVLDLLLGDETRAGFSISCWLQPADSQPKYGAGDVELRSSLASLRAGDVLIVRNVALSVFRNCVYGQTLPKWRVGAGATTVARLEGEAGLEIGMARKTRKVKEWAEAFVGRPVMPNAETVTRAGRGKALHLASEELPPDTQD
ncbi:hypothetical protein LTR95_005171 [Oleoguttula sp. CCFEE 5521]